MKHLPEVKSSCAHIYNIVKGDIQNELLVAAIKWKLFDHLSSPVTAFAIADKIGFHPRNTELFLNVLSGMNIINKKNGMFSNTPESEEFLVSAKTEYLGSFLLHVAEWHDKFGLNIESLIQNGPPEQMETPPSDSSVWADAARISGAYHYCGPVSYMVDIISSLPEFPKMKSMLDMGGGTGIYTIGIVAAHPEMKGVVFEQPPVAVVTREFIREYEAEDRISTMEGDYITDSLGGPYDLILASATLNFFKENFDELFCKIYDSLNPGGVFITHHDGIKNERTQPVVHLSEFLSAEFHGMDFAIPQGLIAESMLTSGFQSVRSFTQPSDFGDMDIDIGRKTQL